MRWIILLLLLSFQSRAQNTLPSLGNWREHLPYGSAIDLAASANRVYAATPFSLFSVDRATGEVERFSKVSGLSETGVKAIAFDPANAQLFVAYTNSNIDVLTEKSIRSIPDLKRANISGDKNIYHIYPDGDRCYLSTGLGVIVLDSRRYEVRESWYIGNGGSYLRVNGFTRNNGFFYAATEAGLKRIATNNANPADFNNWQALSGTAGLSAAPAKAVVTLGNRTIVLQNDSLFVETGAAWSPFFANGWTVLSINVSENKLFVSQRQANGASQVLVLRSDGSIERTIAQGGVISFPQKALSVNGEVWVADRFGGLSRWQGNNPEVFRPDAPFDVALGSSTSADGIVWMTAGAVNDAWNYLYNRGGIYKLEGGNWSAFNQFTYPQLDSLLDFITTAVDPRDGSLWAGSYGGGLLHIKKDGTLQIFKQNSPIAPAVGDPTSYRISGLAFDRENNLWISNYGANQPLLVLKNDGSWQSFTTPFILSENAAAGIVIDDANQKWIISPKGNGLMVMDHNNTIDNPADDKWRIYRQGAGAGNLPSSQVLSIALDKSGFIWVGTTDGVGVIQCPAEAFISGCEAVLPVIRDGAFANFLFKGEEVRSIAVDAADRKWIATSSGAWLVSADGDKVIANFNETNSPLLSNDVKSITINGATGEVFFATAKGISSYRGSATDAQPKGSEVLVFPNPVPPGYSGEIGIRGLPLNSIVKITETNGRLVFQGRATGGQFVWNGRDYKGARAASGIYLVLATDDNKTEKAVGRIVIVQ